ncbi:MAG: TRAM domain-containing protein [Candidatus Binatia bacterium]|nr:TRAM domain-containing protein [Candidatus Binatia bacterium]
MSSHTLTVTIDRLAYGGAGIGRVHGKVLFVPGTVPGDEVEVSVTEEKRRFAVARLLAVRRPSPVRRLPPCPYVPRCGGCCWQQVEYATQLAAKEAVVREQMRRIGGIADPPVLPILAAPHEWQYRHRIRLRATALHRLGFSAARSHEVVEIESCLIADARLTARLSDARAWYAGLQTRVRWIELVAGDARHRRGAAEVVFLGGCDGAFQAADDQSCARFLDTHPSVRGVALCGQGWRRSWGDCRVGLDLQEDGLWLDVGPGVFTQVNPAGNRVLIATLLRLASFRPEQEVIELYCGVGNLSLPIARCVRRVIGVERDQRAVDDARGNAARAGLTNTRFLCASARAAVQRLLQARACFDVVVLDPPRAGAVEVIDLLPRLGARTIVYVSCDPATLARDVRSLCCAGYQLHALQPLDLFPQTYHVETIAILTCRD